MSNNIFLDTNLWIYLHIQAKHGKPYIVKESQVFIGEVVV
jgi:hypothetical protein